MGLYDLLTVIGSRRLVAGTPSPPSGALSLNPSAAGGGFSFHEAAGCRSLRRSHPAGGGRTCLPAVSLAFPGPGRRVAELRAGRAIL